MVQARTSTINKFRRDAWVEVNLEYLEENLKIVHSSVGVPLMPVVKADGYGHGASIISPILESYDFVESFGVASIDEALVLREVGITKPILVLGITPNWAFEAAIKHDLRVTLVDIPSAFILNAVAKDLSKKAFAHLKLDTGLNRIGFKKQALSKFLESYSELENLEIEYLFSHFADANNEDFCKEQFAEFQELTKKLPYKRHMASTVAARVVPESKLDLVRCGIELYGLQALNGEPHHLYPIDIKPIMSLFARVSYIKEIAKGETVSYGRTWTAERDSKIATLPLGYADAVPRSLSNKMQAYCKGSFMKQVGLVTMDQMMFDVTDVPDVAVGDIVELIGEHLPVKDWTEILDTINYEVVTNLNLRLPKVYTRPEGIVGTKGRHHIKV